MTGLVMLFKPFLALAVFAAIVIPLRLLILRGTSPRWRATLLRPVPPRVGGAIWFLVILSVAIAGSLAT